MNFDVIEIILIFIIPTCKSAQIVNKNRENINYIIMALEILKAVIVGGRKGYVLPRDTDENDGLELIQFTEGEELIPIEGIIYDHQNTDGFIQL